MIPLLVIMKVNTKNWGGGGCWFLSPIFAPSDIYIYIYIYIFISDHEIKMQKRGPNIRGP